MNWHIDICKLIYERIQDKNPSDKNGWTPLHSAARNGDLQICKLIIDNVNNGHPVTNDGHTPKDLADQYHHAEISQLFEYSQTPI